MNSRKISRTNVDVSGCIFSCPKLSKPQTKKTSCRLKKTLSKAFTMSIVIFNQNGGQTLSAARLVLTDVVSDMSITGITLHNGLRVTKKLRRALLEGAQKERRMLVGKSTYVDLS